MTRDIVMNKNENIRRCLNRIQEEYGDQDEHLLNYTKRDSIILNLQRACEACIDLAMHIVSELNLGVPQSSRDVFDMLHESGIIDDDLNVRMKAMVGFRNVAVQDYQSIKVEILKSIVKNHLSDFTRFIA